MEAAELEREHEIAALQADLGGVRSELEHWRNTAAKYEEEINRLQEAFTQQQQQQTTTGHLQGKQRIFLAANLRQSCAANDLFICPPPTPASGVCYFAAAVCLFAAGL